MQKFFIVVHVQVFDFKKKTPAKPKHTIVNLSILKQPSMKIILYLCN